MSTVAPGSVVPVTTTVAWLVTAGVGLRVGASGAVPSCVTLTWAGGPSKPTASICHKLRVDSVSALTDVREAIALNVNLDMVSRSDSELWVAGTWQNPALREVVEAVVPADGVVLRFGHDGPEWTGADTWSGASDHAPFDRAGVPFLYFGVEDNPDYPRSTDDPERVDSSWYRASVETILRAVRARDATPTAVEAARAAKAGG